MSWICICPKKNQYVSFRVHRVLHVRFMICGYSWFALVFFCTYVIRLLRIFRVGFLDSTFVPCSLALFFVVCSHSQSSENTLRVICLFPDFQEHPLYRVYILRVTILGTSCVCRVCFWIFIMFNYLESILCVMCTSTEFRKHPLCTV